MHPESMNAMKGFIEQYITSPVKVADVGSYDVNVNYRELFVQAGCEYVRLDISPGPNVDRVVQPDYFGEEKFDVVISSQCAEHIQDLYAWRDALLSIAKPGALICVIVPHTAHEHKYPVDCWRIFPDGMRWLFKDINIIKCEMINNFDTMLIGQKQARCKVLIATPCLTGRLDVWYTNSLVNTVRLAQANNIIIHPVFIAYDSLIQNARNCLFQIAVEGEYDDIIWIDDDMEWNPQWIFDLLFHSVDVVGGTTRKKTDDSEQYVVKTKNLLTSDNGLIKVESLGTGFVRMSRKAVLDLWNHSPEYLKDGKIHRMVCDLEIIDGELYSEDTVIFRKLTQLGYDIWLDPKMTCNHVGTKKFCGSFENYISKL